MAAISDTAPVPASRFRRETRMLFGRLHRTRCMARGFKAGEIGQTVVQQHAGFARLDGRALAALDIDGGVLLERLAGALAGAREHQVDAMSLRIEARARIELEQARLGAALGPHA